MKKTFALLVAVLMLLTSVAFAEYTPSKDMNIRVPFAAGGVADNMARIVGQGLQKAYGKTVYINNLTGANGTIAAADMASVKADATEMMVGGIAMFTLAPLFNPNLCLKLEDYQIVCGLNLDPNLLYVNTAATGIASWEDLVEYAKTNRIIFGSNAPGGATHMLAMMLFGEAGIKAEAVTSNGSAKDLLALAGNNVVCAIASPSVGKQYVDEGTLTPILCMSSEPYTGYEGIEVPTAQSKGYDVVFDTCNFIMTSKDASAEEVDAIYQTILAYSETEEFKKMASDIGWEPVLADGATVTEIIESTADLCADAFAKYYN